MKDAWGRAVYSFPAGFVDVGRVGDMDVDEYLERHFSGDFGEAAQYNQAHNQAALDALETARQRGETPRNVGNIRSAYKVDSIMGLGGMLLFIETSFENHITCCWLQSQPRPASVLDKQGPGSITYDSLAERAEKLGEVPPTDAPAPDGRPVADSPRPDGALSRTELYRQYLEDK